ncbi:IS21 family transposase [Escherichia coli]|nr:IS21 family transposase [Escherichia coli]EHC5085936.1 IS21 family transposase [Escherichia coli]
MPTVPISMRKLKEILRLKYGVGLSHRQIGRSLAISPSVVSRYANRAAQLGIKQWPLPTGWDDTKLKHAFLQTQVKMKKHSLPDWATVHRELRNKCVTLQLLWEEYCERNPGGFYSYNHYCRMYREWLKTTSPSMRQVHKAGEKLFVDYRGPTVGVTDPETGEIRTAQVIVAVLGASSYTWAEATWSQQLEDWVMSHVRCFQWLGGVPELVVPDNLKSATSRACKYDPDVNPTYQQMLEHYNVAVLPARPRKPKDKAKAEVEDYQYSGESQNLGMQLSRVLHRNGTQKTVLTYDVQARRSRNYINDTEIQVQRRQTAAWRLGLQHRHYISQATLDAGVSWQRGTRWFGAQPAPEEIFGEATALSKILQMNASFNLPFTLAEQPFSYSFRYQRQLSNTPLTPQEQFAIGNRWTVRGFDGERTLNASNGWYIRNDLAWRTPLPEQELYLGMDYGEVGGAGSEYLVGRHLAGGVVGLRGQLFSTDYDVFIGRPFSKPAGFMTSDVTAGFNLFRDF